MKKLILFSILSLSFLSCTAAADEVEESNDILQEQTSLRSGYSFSKDSVTVIITKAPNHKIGDTINYQHDYYCYYVDTRPIKADSKGQYIDFGDIIKGTSLENGFPAWGNNSGSLKDGKLYLANNVMKYYKLAKAKMSNEEHYSYTEPGQESFFISNIYFMYDGYLLWSNTEYYDIEGIGGILKNEGIPFRYSKYPNDIIQ